MSYTARATARLRRSIHGPSWRTASSAWRSGERRGSTTSTCPSLSTLTRMRRARSERRMRYGMDTAAPEGRAPAGCDHPPRMDHSRVPLPAGVREPFTVYVNGVKQELGRDYRVADGQLVFPKELVREGRLGFWRWFLGAWGIGTYGRNDQVDVAWDV